MSEGGDEKRTICDIYSRVERGTNQGDMSWGGGIKKKRKKM